jgi:2-dehydro-3-deoxyphosphogluconate aldolase/(4S)-4-hydroxy-2-oxoglutarate aldolase
MQFDKNQIKGILPAVTFETTDAVLKLAEAFLAEGLRIIEIPLRTSVALEAVTILRKHFEKDLSVGVGTVLNEQQLHDAINAGAMFGLAPGLNRNVLVEAEKLGFLFIPGVMTPSDIETALELNCKLVKVFPIEQIGGIKFLKAMEGPYAHTGMQYIPMGGVSIANMADYLTLKQVPAVGGSWLATKEMIREQDFAGIGIKVKEALEVMNSV